jgi:hypothetical protein
MTISSLSMTIDNSAEACQAAARRDRFDRNLKWFERHAVDIGTRFRGKCICVAGEELFVSDTPAEAVGSAKAAHPDDDGFFLHYIPKEKTTRIYAHPRFMAGV